MLPDTILPEFMAQCAQTFMLEGSFYWSPSPQYIKAFSHLVRKKPLLKDRCDSLVNFVSAPREKLKRTISPELKRIVQAMTTGQLDEADRLKLFAGDEEMLDAVMHNMFYSSNGSMHRGWPHYSLVLMYMELYGDELPFPDPTEQSGGTIGSFWNHCEEAIEHYRQLAAGSSVVGQTIQEHLKAEDWDFPKDSVFTYMVDILKSAGGAPYKVGSLLKTSPTHYMGAAENLFSCFSHSLRPRSHLYSTRVVCYMIPSVTQLVSCLKPGLWYDADSLWRYSSMDMEMNDVMVNSAWYNMFKANITAFEDQAEDDVTSDLISRHVDQLLGRPAFFGMLYALALVGILDILEDDPPLKMRRGVRKLVPYSPQDCLKAVRLTDYGLWSLGLSDSKPEAQRDFSDPVLDKDLLLVTYKGTGVKVRSLLSRIAEPLGEARFKVTLQSFTSTCENLDEAEKLISLFCATFGDPWPNWKAFFETVRSSFCALPQESRGRLLKVANKAALKLILDTPDLRKYVRLVEGGFLYVDEDDVRKLDTALAKRGYNNAIGASTTDPVKEAVAAVKVTRSRGRRRYY